MIGAMLMMLQLCTKIRRESDMSARKRSFLGKGKENLLEQNRKGCSHLGGEGTWVKFCWVCVAEPLPHYSLFCGQL